MTGATAKTGAESAPDPGLTEVTALPPYATPLDATDTTYSSTDSVFTPKHVAVGVIAVLLAWLLLRKRKRG